MLRVLASSATPSISSVVANLSSQRFKYSNELLETSFGCFLDSMAFPRRNFHCDPKPNEIWRPGLVFASRRADGPCWAAYKLSRMCGCTDDKNSGKKENTTHRSDIHFLNYIRKFLSVLASGQSPLFPCSFAYISDLRSHFCSLIANAQECSTQARAVDCYGYSNPSSCARFR